MPIYQFKCKNCETEFAVFNKIVDRDKPTTEECPFCEHSDCIDRVMTAPMTVSGVGEQIRSRTPDVFKDRLREIKKTAGRGCTIDV